MSNRYVAVAGCTGMSLSNVVRTEADGSRSLKLKVRVGWQSDAIGTETTPYGQQAGVVAELVASGGTYAVCCFAALFCQ